MKALAALSPKSNNFLSIPALQPLLRQYSACLPLIDNLENEVSILKTHLSQNPIPDNDSGSRGLHSLLECIKPMEMAFPIVSNFVRIALTIGTSTTSVERSFSSLRRLKTYLRSTMTQERLNSLLFCM